VRSNDGHDRAAVKANQDERDVRLESTYTYDRDGFQSTLAYVSAHRDDLVQEFFAWRRNNPGGEMEPAVRSWEGGRFGAQLDVAAHGIVMFGIKAFLAPEGKPKATPAPKARSAGDLSRFDQAAGRLAREHDMGPNKHREEERRRLLEKQRRELEAEG